MRVLASWLRLSHAGIFLALAAAGCREAAPDTVAPAKPPPAVSGVALVLIYDTSGSMADSLPGPDGKPTPKYVSARRATLSVVNRLEAWQTAAAPDVPRRLEAGLVVLADDNPSVAIPLGPFAPMRFRTWLNTFASPRGATPLGYAMREAARQLLATGLTRKHILVITDGENTKGPGPAEELASLQRQAAAIDARIPVHFIAFDVNASVFDPVKRLGADVFSAADEKELADKLELVLQEKILLENEEP